MRFSGETNYPFFREKPEWSEIFFVGKHLAFMRASTVPAITIVFSGGVTPSRRHRTHQARGDNNAAQVQ
ncbi:MAG: hypothetical protein IPJ52_12775 [Rhodocyclaceae bacterium]|jgi:hypothetical protein|nr:hypothetical protein [Rhodocyclaceae bacterium]